MSGRNQTSRIGCPQHPHPLHHRPPNPVMQALKEPPTGDLLVRAQCEDGRCPDSSTEQMAFHSSFCLTERVHGRTGPAGPTAFGGWPKTGCTGESAPHLDC